MKKSFVEEKGVKKRCPVDRVVLLLNECMGRGREELGYGCWGSLFMEGSRLLGGVELVFLDPCVVSRN